MLHTERELQQEHPDQEVGGTGGVFFGHSSHSLLHSMQSSDSNVRVLNACNLYVQT